ncbi:HalOD1 output domain-containing protein [Salinigranum sp. GCM10025319]|uniref:HalOD1 output domain-containing protein n=1 Tax=Salinigranum sp. GCM10025319 TaxID=3252687 RepID=UPI00360A2A63
MVSSPDVRPSDTDALVVYDVGAEESLSDAVLRAASEVVEDLTTVRPLSSVVDVESLDYLFERRRGGETDTRIVAFAAWDLWFVVTVTAIEIYELDEPLDA